MSRVVSAEVFKLRHCKILWTVPVLFFVSGFYLATLDFPVYELYNGLALFALPTLAHQFLAIAAVTLTGYVIGLDFTHGTIRNTLSTGVGRTCYFFSRLGVVMLLLAGLYLLSMLGYVLGHLPVLQQLFGNELLSGSRPEIELFGSKLAICTLFSILQLCAYASVFNAACYFVRKQLPVMTGGIALLIAEQMLGQLADRYHITYTRLLFDYAPVKVLKNTFEVYAIHDKILTLGFLKFGFSALFIIIASSAIGFVKFRYCSENT